ncbi:MAG: acyl-protein synthetase [Lachnospiraceae bacterium]|nr:acyl-protein synthetase [Lachnospiraceae bacterium]
MKSLFWHKKPYDMKKTEALFLKKMRENMLFQYENCAEYREIVGQRGFDAKRIKNLKELAEIPFIPTLYLKHHNLDSMPEEKLITKATSSGTSGKRSVIGYDLKTLWRGLGMVLHIGKVHKLWSVRPCHYIILGYQPKNIFRGSKKVEEKAVAKTAYGFTYFAPALSRTYALKRKDNGYVLNMEEIKQKLIRYSKGRTPVRIMGFPFHAYWLLTQMKEEGITCHLPKGSIMAFGGGWKEYYTQKADKETMYRLIKDVLNISEENCREFFGAVEHPILYCDCKNHHFHVPIYSRVLIRDVDTLEPVCNGTMGLVNLLTPMIQSAAILSVMTDDLGILHDGQECGCGINTPYLEVVGRVGMADITTCAAGAQKLSQNILQEVLK